MSKRLQFSNNRALFIRKYILGTLLILLGLLLMSKGSGGFKFAGFIAFASGIFNYLMRKIEFDQEYVYVGGKGYAFSKVTKLSGFQVNNNIYPYIIIKDNGKKIWAMTDSGQAGLLRILIGAIFPTMDPLKNVKAFKKLYEESC